MYSLRSFSHFVAYGRPSQKHLQCLLTVMHMCCSERPSFSFISVSKNLSLYAGNSQKTKNSPNGMFGLPQLGVLCHETVGRLSRQHTLGLASIIATYSPMQKNCECALFNPCCIIAIAMVKIKLDSDHVTIFVQA